MRRHTAFNGFISIEGRLAADYERDEQVIQLAIEVQYDWLRQCIDRAYASSISYTAIAYSDREFPYH